MEIEQTRDADGNLIVNFEYDLDQAEDRRIYRKMGLLDQIETGSDITATAAFVASQSRLRNIASQVGDVILDLEEHICPQIEADVSFTLTLPEEIITARAKMLASLSALIGLLCCEIEAGLA